MAREMERWRAHEGETVGRKTEDKRNKVNSIRPWRGASSARGGCLFSSAKSIREPQNGRPRCQPR